MACRSMHLSLTKSGLQERKELILWEEVNMPRFLTFFVAMQLAVGTSA